MAVLLLADVIEGQLATDAVAKTLAAVKALGEVHVLVAGMGGDAAAAEAATLDGVSKVIFADDHVYCHGMAEPTAALIVCLAGPYAHIVAASTAFSKSVLPRVAALLDVMVISEVMAVIDADRFERPIYAGNAIQTVKSTDATKVMTIRTATFTRRARAARRRSRRSPRQRMAACRPGSRIGSHPGPPGTDQRRDRRVGRAWRGVEGRFRADREAGRQAGRRRRCIPRGGGRGYAPNDWQVGQTGKVVAPDLYVAVGISGAIQHLAGMKDSKVIVAINKDEEAPIFQVADYGLVADLFTAVPELIEKL